MRIFRIEKRIEKKNADEERELKEVLWKFKLDKSENNNISNPELIQRNDFDKNEKSNY